MNIGLHAVAPSQAPEAGFMTMVLGYITAIHVLDVDFGTQIHERHEDFEDAICVEGILRAGSFNGKTPAI